ncbi:MAG: rhomboid family intramembrane serine protease [Promethearchaeota archaeon]
MQSNQEFSWTDYPVTFSLSITLILVYSVLTLIYPSTLALNDEAVHDWGQVNELVFHGELWRLFTAIFVHGSVVHLLSNVLFLIVFGLRSEELASSEKLFICFFLAGLGGNILSLLWGLSSVSVGASGAVFGIFGMNLMILRKNYRKETRGVLFFALIFFMLTISQQTNVLAHLGGLILGVFLGYLWEKQEQKKYKITKIRRKRYQTRRRR